MISRTSTFGPSRVDVSWGTCLGDDPRAIPPFIEKRAVFLEKKYRRTGWGLKTVGAGCITAGIAATRQGGQTIEFERRGPPQIHARGGQTSAYDRNPFPVDRPSVVGCSSPHRIAGLAVALAW